MNINELRAALTALAANHRWTWSAPTRDLLAQLPGYTTDRHPAALIRALSDDDLGSVATDEFAARVASAVDEATAGAGGDPRIAYFSPEFGLSALVRQYSGGLGVLAGDHLKAASDLGLPLCAVGLFYREGFFRQTIDGGRQGERYEDYEAPDLGLVDAGVEVSVPMPGRAVTARVWRLDVGSVPLYLLDTDVESNSHTDRSITDRLYGGDRRHRLEQELVLGVGGARALSALGLDVPVTHLNEGHAGFMLLELLDRRIADGAGLDEARAAVRPGVVFTTHTPVPAGIDRFDHALIGPYLDHWAQRWSVPVDALLALGHDPADGSGQFSMASLCLTSAGRSNGVSELHGQVSRELFAAVPGGDAIGSVTNGVHACTWTAPSVQALFDDHLGAGWALATDEVWRLVDEISDVDIAAARSAASSELAALVVDRTGRRLDPEVLTFGFARRFATYKRATLLFRRPDVLEELLADGSRPVQFVFAGKAHPADEAGKALIADVARFASSDAAQGRVILVPGYDMEVGRVMTSGCDVWLNNPIRPHEASGTSGEKAALSGCLNLSISDGWWDEMADGRNGWTIPSSSASSAEQRDDDEASAMLQLIGNDVVTEYYADGAGPSAAWLGRIRHNWRTLGPRVTASRMVSDYDRLLYGPALADSEAS